MLTVLVKPLMRLDNIHLRQFERLIWKFSSKSKMVWSLFTSVLYHKLIRNHIIRRINFYKIKLPGIVT